MKWLGDNGIRWGQVRNVFSEYRPCSGAGMGMNCQSLLRKLVPQAKIYYIWSYNSAGRSAKAETLGRLFGK